MWEYFKSFDWSFCNNFSIVVWENIAMQHSKRQWQSCRIHQASAVSRQELLLRVWRAGSPELPMPPQLPRRSGPSAKEGEEAESPEGSFWEEGWLGRRWRRWRGRGGKGGRRRQSRCCHPIWGLSSILWIGILDPEFRDLLSSSSNVKCVWFHETFVSLLDTSG